MGGLPIGSRNRFGAGFWSEARFSPDPLRGRISPRRDHRNGAGRGEKINRRRLGFVRGRAARTNVRSEPSACTHARRRSRRRRVQRHDADAAHPAARKRQAARGGLHRGKLSYLPATTQNFRRLRLLASRAWKGIVPPRRRGGGGHRGSMHVVPGGVLVRMQAHRAATQFELNENAIATR